MDKAEILAWYCKDTKALNLEVCQMCRGVNDLNVPACKSYPQLESMLDKLEKDRDYWKNKSERYSVLVEELFAAIENDDEILYHFPCGKNPCILCRLKREWKDMQEKQT